MKNKFSGFSWDKEGKKPASADEINAKIGEAKDPSITVPNHLSVWWN